LRGIINNIVTILDQFYCSNKELYTKDYDNINRRIYKFEYIDNNNIYVYGKPNLSTNDEDEIIRMIDISDNFDLQIKDDMIIINNVVIECYKNKI
jgi:hypothetical protein